jgi:hypothetical protein
MFDTHLRIKDFVWDPAKDIVHLSGPPLDGRVNEFFPIHSLPRLVELFEKQFPRQIEKMEKLSVFSHFWSDDEFGSEQTEWALVKCPKLKEFIVVLDIEYERECVLRVERLGWILDPDENAWSIPEDIEKSIDNVRSLFGKCGLESSSVGMVPRVRVVMDKSRIFGQENMSIRLRCSPCKLYDIQNI